MKNTRIITIASILIGFCLGIMIKSYINAPEDFVWMDHFGLICIVIGMGLFIMGHLKFKKSIQ